MANDISLQSGLSQNKLNGLSQKTRQKEKEEIKNPQVLQSPSVNGLQWAVIEQQKSNIAENKPYEKTGKKASNAASYELTANNDDIVTLSSTVNVNEASIESKTGQGLLFGEVINTDAVVDAFKSAYRSSRSHNLMFERFVSTMKMGAASMLLTMCGLNPEKIENIKTDVRNEALAQIDSKLNYEWAASQALLEIVG